MMIIDRFSAGLDDMKKKEQADIGKVLKVLSEIKRFSVFEATENTVIANTMTKIMQDGYAESTGGSFPWTDVKITQKGKDRIAQGEQK